MNRRFSSPAWLAAALLVAMLAAGCSPKIGDDCSSSTDCSLRGDRLCDSTQPGGYCTVFNCEPNGCPEESQCVAFQSRLDPVCEDPQTFPRFQRTFCMKRCDDHGDCRGGYDCVNMAAANPWGASVVDSDPEGTKVCISRQFEASDPSGNDALCRGYDGGFADVEYYEPDVEEPTEASVSDAEEPTEASVSDAEEPTEASVSDAQEPADAAEDAEDSF
ncbi:MAG TPA: hypothetical protein PLI95_14695 [Polyangiaceae bacterium]|nr:hypothetical protein [Polyangiaceae bacterium]